MTQRLKRIWKVYSSLFDTTYLCFKYVEFLKSIINTFCLWYFIISYSRCIICTMSYVRCQYPMSGTRGFSRLNSSSCCLIMTIFINKTQCLSHVYFQVLIMTLVAWNIIIFVIKALCVDQAIFRGSSMSSFCFCNTSSMEWNKYFKTDCCWIRSFLNESMSSKEIDMME